MWPFRKKPEPPPKDGMGFDLVPDPKGDMKVSDESVTAFKAWADENSPSEKVGDIIIRNGKKYKIVSITACPLNGAYWEARAVPCEEWSSVAYRTFVLSQSPPTYSTTKSWA